MSDNEDLVRVSGFLPYVQVSLRRIPIKDEYWRLLFIAEGCLFITMMLTALVVAFFVPVIGLSIAGAILVSGALILLFIFCVDKYVS